MLHASHQLLELDNILAYSSTTTAAKSSSISKWKSLIDWADTTNESSEEFFNESIPISCQYLSTLGSLKLYPELILISYPNAIKLRLKLAGIDSIPPYVYKSSMF